jgi:hypothetical protein
MADNTWPNQVLKWMSPRRCKTGRPRDTWMKGIHDAMAEIKIKGQWMDREEW